MGVLTSNRWIVGIDDLTPVVVKMRYHLRRGASSKAKRLLPKEALYQVSDPSLARRLLMD